MNRQQRRGMKADLFQQGVALHQAGRVAEAEQMYRRVLVTMPDEISALGNLGVALLAQQRLAEAIVTLRRALALKPDYHQAAVNLAVALRASGAPEEALAAYQKAAELVPRSASMQNDIAVVLASLGRGAEAIEALREAIRLDPAYADGHANLGRLLLHTEANEEAATAFRTAVDLAPTTAEYLSDLSVALLRLGDCKAAIAQAREALRLKPDLLSAQMNLAAALQDHGEILESLALYQSVAEQSPNNAGAHSSVAAAYWKLGDLEPSVAAARESVRIDPAHINGWFNLGSALLQQGDLDGAIAAEQQALALDPAMAAAELKIAHALLSRGDYARGLPHLECRWRTREKVSHFAALMNCPEWQGEDLDGRTILLHYEQGLGDTLQMLRYVPMVVERGGDVLLLVHPPLQPLMPKMEGVRLITDLADLPDFDVHRSLFSLPLAFGTRVATIPAPIPYLHADPARTARWRRRLEAPGRGGLRVALAWAGNATHKGDVYRSIPLPLFAPLLTVPGLRLFSVQHDLRDDDAAWLGGPGVRITPLGEELTDFAETAAALSAMDVVVTVDTSVCHLAGAMGLPVWLLLWSAPEWRWATDHDRSTWYPSIRLVRQPELGDWSGLIAQVADELASLARSRAKVTQPELEAV